MPRPTVEPVRTEPVVGRAELATALRVLQAGGLVAFPTETVYGLGCDAENTDALRRLYAVKRRPTDHPVIVHLASPDLLDEWAIDIGPDAARLAAACWPGPLTLVLRRSGRVPDEVTGGHPTVAVRVPDQPVALELLRAFGAGLAAPSANRFGRVSATTAAHVRADLGAEVDVVLDGGACRIGVESTIVDCSGDRPAILRLGGVPVERIEELLGRRVARRTGGETAAPGTLPAHYAPRARVVVVEAGAALDAVRAQVATGARVGLLAPAELYDSPSYESALFHSGLIPEGVVVLGAPEGADEYAQVLYARLREADEHHLDVLVAVAPGLDPAPGGLGAAILDRLTRAAAGSVR